MPKIINILPSHLANKIAAGEVVGRPASALKELLENSIDAGAKNISIILRDFGKSLIQVVDDGAGMNAEDAVLAFERHATSKIAVYEDLENILTFGFRGEALASICAVSQVDLRTRQDGSDIGTRVRVEGGILMDIGEDAPPVGTSIAVKNLFYNTPGRRNFLKSNATEFKRLCDVVYRAAISHPEVGFKLFSQDEILLDVRNSTPAERVRNVFGDALFSTLFPFEHDGEMIRMSGFLGKPAFARKTRTEQYLFLNNRHIVNKTIGHAVFSAYEHLLEKGSFAFFILFLQLDPHKFDINVHPSKMEVKFADEQYIYRSVFSAVRNALGSADLVPQMGAREEGSEPTNNFRMQFVHSQPNRTNAQIAGWREFFRPPDAAERPQNIPESFDEREETVAANTVATFPVEGGALEGAEAQPPERNLGGIFDGMIGKFWQVHNKYIIVPVGEGVMIVDQHAAHERVLYERTVARFNKAEAKTQHLLFPLTFDLPPGDTAMVRQLQPLLEGLGFSIKFFGNNTVIVDGIPVDVKQKDENTILRNLLDTFKENEHEVKFEPRERLAKIYSCKAAIKSGDPLNETEIRSLLEQLFATELPFTCPHGRPAIVTLSLSELDRRFGRTPVT